MTDRGADARQPSRAARRRCLPISARRRLHRRLPPKLLQAVRRCWRNRPSLDPNLAGADIKTAFQKSGLFLEASLAVGRGAVQSGVPDLKAALVVLRQTLQSVLGAGRTGGRPKPAPAHAGRRGGAELGADRLRRTSSSQEILLPQSRLPVAEDLADAFAPAGRFCSRRR